MRKDSKAAREMKIIVKSAGSIWENGYRKNDTTFILKTLAWIAFFDPANYKAECSSYAQKSPARALQDSKKGTRSLDLKKKRGFSVPKTAKKIMEELEEAKQKRKRMSGNNRSFDVAECRNNNSTEHLPLNKVPRARFMFNMEGRTLMLPFTPQKASNSVNDKQTSLERLSVLENKVEGLTCSIY